MKKNTGAWVILLLLSSGWGISSCSKQPKVLSLENFATYVALKQTPPGIEVIPTPLINGKWYGLDHEIRIETGPDLKDTLYKAILSDTDAQNTIPDTSLYYLMFLRVKKHLYVEVINESAKPADHDFGVPLSTYFLVQYMGKDTVLFQRMNADFLHTYLNKKTYRYFIREIEEKEDNPTIFITEKPDQLALLLKDIATLPGALCCTDTLIRKK